MKGCILILAALLLGATQAKLNVQIYYEALCPDSIRFLTKQFFPTWYELKDQFDVELVPFGKATVIHRNGKYEFTCQHGPNECLANKYHACAIREFPGEDSVRFIDCGMETSHPNEEGVLKWCANKFKMEWQKLQNCYQNGEADELLDEFGNKTLSVRPKITFVPTITFDGKYDQSLQDQSLTNFYKTVCSLLSNKPKACKDI